jgi:hypothetical protein
LSEAEQTSFSFKDIPPDMTVMIQTNVYPLQKENSRVTITSPHFLGPRNSEFSSSPDFLDLVDARFAEFSERSGRDIKPLTQGARTVQSTPALMRGFGELLYDKYAPELFKTTFWELKTRLGNRFRTILIITDDPTIPWELMRPRRDANSPADDFLGLEHSIGRLHDQKGRIVGDTQPQSSAISGMTVIAPVYDSNSDLPWVSKEVTFLKTLTVFDRMDGVRRAEANFWKLGSLFEIMPSHIIHFAGHGSQGVNEKKVPDASILLGDVDLNADAWRGLLGRGGPNRPFFFLNACEVGRSGSFSGFVDGLAPAALEAGASGYIGALWSIGDKGADSFAESFYKQLSAELETNGSVSIAELVRKTKRGYLENGDPTFLAYVYYGDPNLKLVVRK